MGAVGRAMVNLGRSSPMHPDDAAMALAVERWLTHARWFIIVVVVASTPFLAAGTSDRIVQSLMIMVLLGGSYNLVLQLFILPRYRSWLTLGYLTTILDIALTSYAVLVCGGFNSPLYLAYFLLVISAAMRYGPRASLVAAACITLLYVSVSLYSGREQNIAGELLLRSGFIWLIAVFAGFLSQRAAEARGALRAELRRTKALNQATSAPSASLALDVVLQSVVEQASVLVEADIGMVVSHDTGRQTYRARDPGLATEGLAELLSKHPTLRRALLDAGHPVTSGDAIAWLALASGDVDLPYGSFIGCPLTAHDEVVGELFLARKAGGQPFDAIDHEAVVAFASRAALAMENSFLYESLKENVEEIKRTQSQLIQSAKLAAIGELAANVAHEINNPLTGILMQAGLLLEATPGEDPVAARDSLNLIYQETLRARRIVRNLLDFARQSQPLVSLWNVNDVLQETLPLVQHRADMQKVKLVEDWGEKLRAVALDANQVKQVFVNLINNAIDAMPEGGRLEISTRGDDRAVRVVFRDHGVGIPADNLPRLFEPFFSTKPAVKGTGLGLSVSHGIISKHGGTIEVASEVGKGSVFTVTFPTLVEAKEEAGCVA